MLKKNIEMYLKTRSMKSIRSEVKVKQEDWGTLEQNSYTELLKEEIKQNIKGMDNIEEFYKEVFLAFFYTYKNPKKRKSRILQLKNIISCMRFILVKMLKFNQFFISLS